MHDSLHRLRCYSCIVCRAQLSNGLKFHSAENDELRRSPPAYDFPLQELSLNLWTALNPSYDCCHDDCDRDSIRDHDHALQPTASSGSDLYSPTSCKRCRRSKCKTQWWTDKDMAQSFDKLCLNLLAPDNPRWKAAVNHISSMELKKLNLLLSHLF